MGCVFCASARYGLARNLLPSEMLAQAVKISQDAGERVSNIVVMGTGEPFDNYGNTLKFLRLANDRSGLNIGMRHMTVSTCGMCDGIRAFAEEGLQAGLSVSLHAPDDGLRSSLMPVNKKWKIADVMSACEYYVKKTGRRVTFEYALIDGVNDSPEQAERLAKLLSGKLCHVNLIPVNPAGTGHKAPAAVKTDRFCDILNNAGITATKRRPLGAGEEAACGQLRSREIQTK